MAADLVAMMAGGRPLKLTDDVRKKLAEAVQAGLVYELACQYAGVHYATFRRWMLAGETAKSGKFRELYETVKDAEGKGALKNVLLVAKAAAGSGDEPGDWRAASWLLERRYPQHYGRSRVEHTGAEGAPIRQTIGVVPGVDLTKLDDNELATMEALLLKAGRAVESAPALPGPEDDDDGAGG